MLLKLVNTFILDDIERFYLKKKRNKKHVKLIFLFHSK